MRFFARYLRHTRAGIWYFRLAVPAALRPHIGSREVVRSLRTTDRREALLLSRRYAIEVGDLFLGLEKAMARDDLDELLAQIRAGRTSAWTLRDAKTGIEISTKPGDPDDHSQGMEALKLVLAARGNDAAGVAATPEPKHPNSRRLSELGAMLVSERRDHWSAATRIEYESALGAFQTWAGDVPIATIDSRRIADYTRHLREKKQITQRTIDKKLSPVAALFGLAQRDGDYPVGDLPTKGHQRYRKEKKSRQGDASGWAFFAPGQLDKIFAPETLLALKKPHEFWMPLLGIYTGARIGELAQRPTCAGLWAAT